MFHNSPDPLTVFPLPGMIKWQAELPPASLKAAAYSLQAAAIVELHKGCKLHSTTTLFIFSRVCCLLCRKGLIAVVW